MPKSVPLHHGTRPGQCCHRTVTKNADASDFPPTQQPSDKSLARQPGLTFPEFVR